MNGPVRRFFGKSCCALRCPLLGEYFQSADVEISIMKKTFEFRHLTSKESPVLADAVTAHRRYACVTRSALGRSSFELDLYDLPRPGDAASPALVVFWPETRLVPTVTEEPLNSARNLP